MSVRDNTKKKITGILLLSLFAVYFAGITSFPHIHETGSQRIVHSHPYSGNHSHSDHSISTIGQLSLFITAAAASFALGGVYPDITGKIDYAGFQCFENPALSYKHFRAPPVMVN